MKKLLISIVLSLALGFSAFSSSLPDEGMWLPMFVERLNYVDMQKMGLHLTADELYSINHSSLKDAIVGLASGSAPNGYFCTSEVVSGKGLLFTNHHCGFGSIQEHSSVDHDYLTEGFWATKYEEELPNEGMTASFLVRMEDVTQQVLGGLDPKLSEADRTAEIKKITSKLKKDATEDGKYEVALKGFFSGNEYYMFVYRTYKDVRLVGAPPSSIGKFGGDTDNWMWPRQTGDFSILRIYASADGSPAAYSKENVPLETKYHLPISLKGVTKDDFTMIWGYPGSTERFLTSYGISFNVEKSQPALVKIWGKQLETWKADMDASDAIRIKYSSKYFGISNSWKNYIGQIRGLKKLKVADKKRQIETDFMAWVNADPKRMEKYGNCLKDIEAAYQNMSQDVIPLYYAALAGMNGAEIFGLAQEYNVLHGLLEKSSKDKKDVIKTTIDGLRESAKNHFKDYNMATDQKTLAALFKLYYTDVPKDQLPAFFAMIEKKYKGNFDKFAADLYAKSIFANETSLNAFLDNPSYKKLDKDPAYTMMNQLMEFQMKYSSAYRQGASKMSSAERLFIAGLREMNPNKVYYPDANSTMRMSYGKVLDYYPADAVHYDYVTHLSGVMQKEDPSNEEFIVSQKLKDLYQKKDFGRYGSNGDLVTCFLTTNDITGGNSGSPVINADGQLIGLAFDGNWEAMSGDIAFEPELQRTICVDIRYVLFVIDKYANAQNIMSELDIKE